MRLLSYCLGIGQTREVQVYRLIAKNTYENEMFNRASLKLGLGQAIMGSMASSLVSSEPSALTQPKSREEIGLMLRRGFYYQQLDESEPTQVEDDIDKIMQRDAKVIQYQATGLQTQAQAEEAAEGGAASSERRQGSNRFAKASFVPSKGEGEWNDADFWDRMFPEAAAREAQQMLAAASSSSEQLLLLNDNVIVGKRKRRMLHGTYEQLLQDKQSKRRRGKGAGFVDEDEYQPAVDSDGSQSSSSVMSADEHGVRKVARPLSLVTTRVSAFAASSLNDRFERSLLRFGYGRWSRIKLDMSEQLTAEMAAAMQRQQQPQEPRQQSDGSLSLGVLELLSRQVQQTSEDELRQYAVGWLKMLLLHTKSRTVFGHDSDAGSDSDGPSRGPRMRKRARRGGHTAEDEVHLLFCRALADDARRIILEERERRRLMQPPKPAKPAQQLQPVPESPAQQAVADSSQPPAPLFARVLAVATVITVSADAARLDKWQQQEHAARDERKDGPAPAVDAAASPSAAKSEAATEDKEERKDASGKSEKAVEQPQQEEEEEDEAQLSRLHFLELLELIPVDSYLLTPHLSAHMTASGSQWLKRLQLLHQLTSFMLTDAAGRPSQERCGWPITSDLNKAFQSIGRRRQYVEQNLGLWWREHDDDWQLLLALFHHGIDDIEAVRSSPQCDFSQRIGSTAQLQRPNPAHLTARQALAFAGEQGSPAAVEAAKEALKHIPASIELVVRVEWPAAPDLLRYRNKLLNALKHALKTRAKRLLKQEEQRKLEEAERRRQVEEEARDKRRRQDEYERRQEERRLRQLADEEKRRSKENRKKADDALHSIMTEYTQHNQQREHKSTQQPQLHHSSVSSSPDKLRKKQKKAHSNQSAAVAAESSSPPSSRLHQQSISTFFPKKLAKPRLPLVPASPLSGSAAAAPAPLVTPPAVRSRVAPATTASSSRSFHSSSHASSSSSFLSPRSQLLLLPPPPPELLRRPVKRSESRIKPRSEELPQLIDGWAVHQPQQSRQRQHYYAQDDDDEGDRSQDEDEQAETDENFLRPLPQLPSPLSRRAANSGKQQKQQNQRPADTRSEKQVIDLSDDDFV